MGALTLQEEEVRKSRPLIQHLLQEPAAEALNRSLNAELISYERYTVIPTLSGTLPYQRKIPSIIALRI